MNEKQKQEVGNNSKAIQVNGDVIIAPAYNEVRTIFIDLFNLNFPKIQEIAKQEADIRIQELLNNLKETFIKQQDRIDINKLKEPGIQYEMYNIIKNAVRFGKRDNMKELCEVFSSILDKDCTDIAEIVIIETLEILPKLNKRQVAFLSLMALVYEISIISDSLTQLETFLEEVLPNISDVSEISFSEISYLTSVNCLSRNGITSINFNPIFIKNIEGYSKMKSDDIKREAEKSSLNNIMKIYNYMDEFYIGRYSLSLSGRLIGWIKFSDVLDVDLRTLF